jgi:hypothetical protein
MLEKLRQKIFRFIESPKDVPLLAGFSIGLYMVLYYYSKNFGLANSIAQLLFFIAYYMLSSVAILYIGYKVLGIGKLSKFRKQFLFITIPVLLGYFLMDLSLLSTRNRIVFALVIMIVALYFLSKKFAQYYKFFIVIILFLAVFNLVPVLKIGYVAVTSTEDWRRQPDDITNIVFKTKPNIYYIQPDGYASFKNLQDTTYNYNNKAYEHFLKQNGFKLYNNFRSNYYSTLLSNTSMFSMKHHYADAKVAEYSSRSIILGNNPVLEVFKNNKYKTHFISEKPYLQMNRPSVGYDYSNFESDKLPFLKDGWSVNEEIQPNLKRCMELQNPDGNFYFIEKFSPGHISGIKLHSAGAAAEKKMYLTKLDDANKWLMQTISFIEKADPDALIIIAADHGGFLGFDYTEQSETFTENTHLVNSIFGASLAIRWNNATHTGYDVELKTAVNLFRTVFSFLAQDKKYLNFKQEDGSYLVMKKPAGLYKYINDDGAVVFEKQVK